MLKILSSTRITVVCLLLLFVLTFWGTIAQVNQGLYIAQQRFFDSFVFLAGGFIPFPGAQLVLWVLFFNLLAAGITHFIRLRHWRYTGLKIIHAGLLIYFVSAYVTFHVAKESNVHLAEGEGTNVSSSYYQWELAYWTETGNLRHVTAVNTKNFKPGHAVSFPGMPVTVEQFYPNAAPFTKALPSSGIRPINSSGITLLEFRKVNKQPEKNLAGGLFMILGRHVLLYGGDAKPTKVGPYYFVLRHTRYQLPFTILLDNFKAQFHPGTDVAKSFESDVTIIQPGASRQVRIYMNHPFRYKDYTFYQSSYDVDAMGRQYTLLAVVKNSGRLLPYLACFTVLLGLIIHFLTRAFEKRLKK